MVDIVITDRHNHTLLPPTQFETYRSVKYSQIPAYDSVSPEIIMSGFSATPVETGKQMRLWFGEDLVNILEGDNGGTVCCTVLRHVFLKELHFILKIDVQDM